VSDCRLYLITPPTFEPRAFAEELKRALDGGDVACLQLRLKDVSDGEIMRAAEVLMPIAQKRDVAFIINDRPDIAHMIRADGVHIGQEDTPYAEAREIVGKDAIVGVTCHNSRDLAFEAGEAGADYVAFGAFFPTKTKEPKTVADIELLQWWAETMTVPVVAIGGITVENAKPLVDARADFIAVSAGVWNYAEGPHAAVKAFNSLF
jgi:thiamine-phosphate pyrophosphorylase